MANIIKKDIAESKLVKFYSNKNILVTGCSGFIGKLIVQKLLRTCPDVKGIYVIFRQKHKEAASERLDKVLENPVFDPLRNELPDFRKKLHPVAGNLQYEGLGLNTEDRQMLIDEIHIVLHAAATVNFDESLRTAVNINVRGTRELLNLCEEMPNLICVNVVSTVYSFFPRWKIGEFFMLPPATPDTMIKMVNDIDEANLNSATSNLLGEWPNTYTYTKAIMEDIVNSKRGKLPIGMYRPSIVIPTYKEPLLSWTDNLNGIVKLSLVFSMGVAHVLFAKKDARVDLTPGDYCVNGFLASTYDVYNKYKDEFLPEKIIYHNVTTTKHTITCKELQDYVTKYNVPLSNTIWHPASKMVACPVLFWFYLILLHIIPALFLDAYALARKKEPRYLKLYFNFGMNSGVLSKFTTTEWNFDNTNLTEVWNNLNQTDKNLFPFDNSTIDWNEYFKNYMWGLRKYILKENMEKETLERGTMLRNRYKMIHFTLKYLMYATIAIFVYSKLF